MIVRIRLRRRPWFLRQHDSGYPNQFALALAELLTPATVVAAAFAVWRIAADLNWAGSFAIPSGLFSHWQSWVGAVVILQLCSRILNRFGKGGDTATS